VLKATSLYTEILSDAGISEQHLEFVASLYIASIIILHLYLVSQTTF